jgi:LDH2 family malate/lactate/ureidoglycolate dehydrogenase
MDSETLPERGAAMNPGRIFPDELTKFAARAFQRLGMPEPDAELCADTLVQADLWGHQSHGVLRLSWYLARIKAGVCQAVARPEVIIDSGAIVVIDGHDGMGQVLMARAMEEAIARAKKFGVSAVAVRNSNHFGTAFYFARMAARRGCIVFLTSNGSPAMAPWGGRKKLVGNNPWSWACPAGARPPMVLDIANTNVARGKIYLARQRGEGIPQGWALSADGQPTTDPEEAIKGILLPMAGHKGYAISVIMDMLSGVLTGSGFGAQVCGPYQFERRSNAGHFTIVLDINQLQTMDEFERRIEAQIVELKSAPLAGNAEAIFYPGEIEAQNDLTNRRDGLALPDATVVGLRTLADELDLTALLPEM